MKVREKRLHFRDIPAMLLLHPDWSPHGSSLNHCHEPLEPLNSSGPGWGQNSSKFCPNRAASQREGSRLTWRQGTRRLPGRASEVAILIPGGKATTVRRLARQVDISRPPWRPCSITRCCKRKCRHGFFCLQSSTAAVAVF